MNDTTTSTRAMVHTAAGCCLEAMTAEEAAWAAERSSWMELGVPLPGDGFADGGEPYTDEEMDLMAEQAQAMRLAEGGAA